MSYSSMKIPANPFTFLLNIEEAHKLCNFSASLPRQEETTTTTHDIIVENEKNILRLAFRDAAAI